MSKSKKIAVDKNLLDYMISNVSERANTPSRGKYYVPLKLFYSNYKNSLTARKLTPLTYQAFLCEFDRILKHQYKSAKIIKRDRRYIVLNLVESTFIESKEPFI